MQKLLDIYNYDTYVGLNLKVLYNQIIEQFL